MDNRSSLSIYHRIEGFNADEAVKLFSGIRIGIDRYGIGFVTPPQNDPFLHHWDLGYGPIDSSFSV